MNVFKSKVEVLSVTNEARENCHFRKERKPFTCRRARKPRLTRWLSAPRSQFASSKPASAGKRRSQPLPRPTLRAGPPQRCAPPRPASISSSRLFPPLPPSAGSSTGVVARPLPDSGARGPYLVIRRGRRASQGASAEPAQRAEGTERSTLRAPLNAWGARTGVGRSRRADLAQLSVPPTGRPVSLGTMRLSAVATSAPLLVAALQVLFLLEAAHSQAQNTTQTNQTKHEILRDATNITEIQSNLTSSTTKPVTSPSSTNTSASTSKTTETPQVTTKSSAPGTNSTVKPLATTRSAPQSTTAHSASKSSAATASNGTMTTTATLATATANINAQINKGSKFDIGSFVGGIVLTLGVLSVLYIGCKTYYSRGIRYRTIDEHDAII
ncbi:porimin [Petaurus breviceps papuanus]|uniref:porimin n=1 Tax=Petaurus breviceps papuanus TaxID=3040969 RepID=UPI0036DCFBFF